MKIFLSCLIGIHAAVHLLGFIKAFELAKVEQLAQPISKTNGLLWLLAAILFFISIVLFLFDLTFWWIIAAAAIVISQCSIFLDWKDAKYGTLLNLLILGTIAISLTDCSSRYSDIYKSESEKRLQVSIIPSNVTEQDILHLPAPVQKYLHYVGAVGKPKVHNVRASFMGEMKRKIDSDWLEISAQQYEFYGDNARLFYIESSMYGIPFDGLHKYVGDSATMQIAIASLFQIVDAKGEKMTRGETVTLFNDMCLLAPATLIDSSIRWEIIDSLTVKAAFTNRNQTISAILFFNQTGELTNFSSDDRYLSEDGETYYNYQWTTPVKAYKEFTGRKIPTYAEAIWHTPEGEFPYARFETIEIEYNCREFK